MCVSKKIICALDVNNFSKIDKIIKNIEYDIIYKVGMEFFYNFGLNGIHKLKKKNKNIKIFLDLKLHDIPNTVSQALEALVTKVEPYIITVHVTGGKKMMREVIRKIDIICEDKSISRPLIFGVTVLTSLDDEEIRNLGWSKNIQENVIRYSLLAKDSGLNGVVCSALETKKVKEVCGSNFKIITPGIRLIDNNHDDQARVVTPEKAIKDGSDFIVIGRPIINSDKPNLLIKKIINELSDE